MNFPLKSLLEDQILWELISGGIESKCDDPSFFLFQQNLWGQRIMLSTNIWSQPIISCPNIIRFQHFVYVHNNSYIWKHVLKIHNKIRLTESSWFPEKPWVQTCIVSKSYFNRNCLCKVCKLTKPSKKTWNTSCKCLNGFEILTIFVRKYNCVVGWVGGWNFSWAEPSKSVAIRENLGCLMNGLTVLLYKQMSTKSKHQLTQ